MAKILNRVLGAAGVAILVSSLGVLAACSESTDENASAKETVSNANVALTLYDDNGIEVGRGSGILIAEKTVLTSAHLIAGKGKWTVTAADGRKVNGIRGQTFDWKRYDSLMAHPRKHDVGVVFLDRPIQLASYPKISTVSQPNGEQVMRVRNDGGKNFQFIDAKLDRVRQMPNAYITEIPASETLDTGGAVVNGKGEIVGIVTGRGMQTGKLYIAKLGEVVGWLSDKANCGGATTSGGALSVRTIGVPTKPGCTKDAGTNISKDGGSSGGSSGTSGGSSGTGSSSGASGSSSGSSGGDGGKCEVGGGYEYPGGGGSTGVSSPVGSNGSSENGSLGGSGTGGGAGSGSGTGTGTGTGGGTGTGENGSSTNGTTPGTGTGGTGSGTGTGTGSGTGTGENGGSTTGTTPGTGTGGTGSGSSTGTGTGAGTPSGSNTGSNTGTIPGGSSGGAGSAGLDEEVCEGESDNPDICPPETANCEGSECGGANAPADNTIDYGDCGCGSSGSQGSGTIILR